MASSKFSNSSANNNNDGDDANNTVTLTVDTVKPTIGINAQIGSDIDGEATGDWTGFSVSLSSDGSIVAIGAYGNDGNGDSSGHVRLYDGMPAAGFNAAATSMEKLHLITAAFRLTFKRRQHRRHWRHWQRWQWHSSAMCASTNGMAALVQRGSDIDGEAAFDYTALRSRFQATAASSPLAHTATMAMATVQAMCALRMEWQRLVQRGSDIDGEAAVIGAAIRSRFQRRQRRRHWRIRQRWQWRQFRPCAPLRMEWQRLGATRKRYRWRSCI